MNIMLAFFFLCTGAHSHFMNHRRKNKEEKILGESALEVCSFKKGFEEHCDILTCIWQDQVWLQFIAALSSALEKNRANCWQVKRSKRRTHQGCNSPHSITTPLCPLTVWFPCSAGLPEWTKAPKALMGTHHLHPEQPDRAEQEEHLWEQRNGAGSRGMVQGAEQLPPPHSSPSPGPGWNLAPVPLCTQDRWQERRQESCASSQGVAQREGISRAGSPRPWSLPPSRHCWKHLAGRGGPPLLDATAQIFRRWHTLHVSCLMNDFLSHLWTAVYLLLLSPSIPVI